MANFSLGVLEIHTWLGYQENFMEKWPITNKKKQPYTFIENNASVPLQNSNYVILHEPTNYCFRYNCQTMQLMSS